MPDGPGRPAYPRLRRRVSRVVDLALFAVWVVGLLLVIRAGHRHPSFVAVVALLAAITAVEVVFTRWNEGRWRLPRGTAE